MFSLELALELANAHASALTPEFSQRKNKRDLNQYMVNKVSCVSYLNKYVVVIFLSNV